MIDYLKTIAEGYSEGIYNDKKYGITKTIFNKGKSIKLYAEELGGNDFISLNYYVTKDKDLLKPCEMPEAKVIDFVKNVKLIPSEQNNL
ncbi:MAG: peptide methionine sulfoxide reductase [Flavobacteriaceae bacterium]